jgi:hypothetical protein
VNSGPSNSLATGKTRESTMNNFKEIESLRRRVLLNQEEPWLISTQHLALTFSLKMIKLRIIVKVKFQLDQAES